MAKKKKCLRQAKELAIKGRCVDHMMQLKNELNNLFMKEEKCGTKNPIVHWIISRDKNAGYFQNTVSQLFCRNRINGIQNSNGEMCTGDDNIAPLLVDYYQQLFTTSNPTRIDEFV